MDGKELVVCLARYFTPVLPKGGKFYGFARRFLAIRPFVFAPKKSTTSFTASTVPLT